MVPELLMLEKDHLWPNVCLKDNLARCKNLGPHFPVELLKLNVALEMYHTRFISSFVTTQLIIFKKMYLNLNYTIKILLGIRYSV